MKATYTGINRFQEIRRGVLFKGMFVSEKNTLSSQNTSKGKMKKKKTHTRTKKQIIETNVCTVLRKKKKSFEHICM